MARTFLALITGLLFATLSQNTALALDGSFVREVIIEKDTDYFGFDLQTRKKVSLQACQKACIENQSCRAFTYNVKARFCFLKSDFAQATAFKGAISGRIVTRSSEPDLGAAPKLSSLADSWYPAANDLRRKLLKAIPNGSQGGFQDLVQQGHDALGFDEAGAAVDHFRAALSMRPDESDLWLALSTAYARLAVTNPDREQARRARSGAITSAINAYQTSRYRSERAQALSGLGHSLEKANWFREALSAFKMSLALRENPKDRADYARLLQSHGFRMLTHSLDADIKVPRACLQFSEDVKKGFGDFASYIRVDQQQPKSLDVSTRQICIEGLAHGRTYQIDVREGLPAENGERLMSNLQLDLYVRDRSASMRFTGNNYVLPASNRRGIPLVSVNSEEAKLSLYRIGERSLAHMLQGASFLRQLSSWNITELVDRMGAPVWKGSLAIRPKKNEEVITAIPIDEALPERKPGVYLLTAATKTHDLKDYPSLASQWFVISDIGLTTFTGTGSGIGAQGGTAELGGLQVFTRSLASAKPLVGVDVELIAVNNEVLATGISDASGMVTFDAGLVRGTDGLAPAVLTAAKGDDDFVFLDLTRPGFDLSDRGVTGRTSPLGVDVYAWTERGVYRPGEQVHLSAMARDASARAVDDLPLTFIFERPDGVEAQRLIGSGKSLGGYSVSLPLTSNARRGTWHARVYTDPKKPALAELNFLVEDFIPDRTDMTLKPDTDVVKQGEAATGAIEGRYLYGAPAAGLKVDGNVLVRETRGRKGYDGYIFGLDEEDNTGIERITLRPLPPLDEAGLGRYGFTLGQLKASTRPKVADLVLRMQEGSGRAIERRVRYHVQPKTTMLGIKPLFDDGQVSENSNADFTLIAVDPEGQRTSETYVDWSLIKIDRHYQWYRQDSRWNYEAVDLESKVADGQIDLTAGEAAKLSLPVEWGRYRLALGEATSFEFHAGWSSAAGSIDTPDGLELALDKTSYKAGETAHLKVSPRFSGSLLLAIGTDQVLETLSFDIPAEGATIDIPVAQDWGAGAYLLANLYRPSDKDTSRNPARAIGVQWLPVEPEDRALSIEIDSPATTRPHEQLVVPIKVAGLKQGEEAYVNVALVDEGILNLTNYKTPDPVARYFGQRRLGVSIRDIYGRLIDGSAGAFGALRTGGDAGGPQMQSKGNKPTQELVAFVSGIVRLDDDGEAEVAFDIPQFNGTARLMATAWTAKAVGSTEQDNIIRDPIVVHVSLPKVLAPGDTSRALVELTNLEAPVGDYHLDVTSDGIVEVDMGQIPKLVTLAKDKMLSLSLPITAQKAGTGDVTVRLASASGDGTGVLHEALVTVRSGVLPITRISQVPLQAGSGKVMLDSDMLAGFTLAGSQLSLSVAPEGTYDVTSLLMQLDRYPYGCAEQITSRALPLLYAKDIALHLPQELSSLSGKQMDQRLQKSVDTLLSYQSNQGGFSLWGNGLDDPWLSAYVADFLTRAKEQGLKVPAAPMKQALTSVQNRLAYQSDLSRDSASVAYGLYVLARNRMASAGDLRYYIETKLNDFRSPLARAQLGAAMALYGDRPRAELAFNSALTLAQTLSVKAMMPIEDSYSFSSIRRDVAAMQALAGEITPSLSSLDGIKTLARELHDPERRLNTQEQAWMVLAARADIANVVDLGIELNGQAIEGPLTYSVTGDALSDAPLSIANHGDKDLVAQVTTIATPEAPLPAGGDGFVISRSYHRLDGSPANVAEVAQNERLVVVVTASQLDDLPSRIMISDLLPAGLEIENPHLIKSADLENFQWLPKTDFAHVEFRDDRLLAAIDHAPGGKRDFTLAYTVRAVSPGTYMHPAAVIEDMYRPEKSARTASGWMTVTQP
ncbi:alpha-2-macroglobulin family protein [Cohaesibacter celericrescens]|nr:alpha-2-macroglobulin family protein [Cohaesibacter celericrescens]